MPDTILIECPTCGSRYRAPRTVVGRRARCAKCQTKFLIRAEDDPDKLDVLGWLSGGAPVRSQTSNPGASSTFMGITPADTHSETPPVAEGRPTAAPERGGTKSPGQSPVTPSASPEAGRSGAALVKLERIDEMGAFFEFPTERLNDVRLRGAFPHLCLSCGSGENLDVHLIVFSERLPERDYHRANEYVSRVVGRLNNNAQAKDPGWIEQLPRLQTMPPPFDLPFPYYVCPRCSAIGAVVTHVLHHDRTEYCQINIQNLKMAAVFLSNAGGTGSEDHKRLAAAAKQQHHDRWQLLPLPVRNRLRQWYQPVESERFLGYYADEDFAKAEAGVAGLVLTDRRLICKKFSALRTFEHQVDGLVEIRDEGTRTTVEVTTLGAKPSIVHLDPAAAEHLSAELKMLRSRLRPSSQRSADHYHRRVCHTQTPSAPTP